MDEGNLIPLVLLALFFTAVLVGMLLVICAYRWVRLARTNSVAAPPAVPLSTNSATHAPEWYRPIQHTEWLAIRSRDVLAVQRSLALVNPIPCSWNERMDDDESLFIAPPINGWILVFGAQLPDPSEDVDECYRFLCGLSRRIGHVQFFKADRLLQHHAWVRVESGRVVRAYAWGDSTLWNQGMKSDDEIVLKLKCHGYTDSPAPEPWVHLDYMAANVDKVPLLAGRWSVNPAAIDPRLWETSRGITGRAPRRF